MNFFEEATLRLKQQLGVMQDKQVADVLGLTPRAWAGRKKEGKFPEKELRALAQKEPGLGVDVEYVLTGGVLTPRQREAFQSAQRFTVARSVLNGEGEAELQARLAEGLKALGLQAARRAPTYEQLVELLNDCSDETLDLAVAVIKRLRLADISKLG